MVIIGISVAILLSSLSGGIFIAQNAPYAPISQCFDLYTPHTQTLVASITEPIEATSTYPQGAVAETQEIDKYNINCSCVLVAHSINPKVQLINARDMQPNITYKEVRVGDLILQSYPKTEHVAVITDIQIEGYIVTEGNYKPCEYSEGRVVKYNSKNIRGFLRP